MYFLTGDHFSKRKRDRAVEDLNGFQVERVVRAYEQEGDRLIGEFSLKGVSLSELQDLFGESKQNLMVDSYPISSTQASYFQKRLNTAFDCDTFDYFLECDAV
jgi:hypothetical protein